MVSHTGCDPTSPIAPDRVRLSTPGQIVAAIPYLVGFRPESSGVVISLRRRMVGLTMRFDLDAPAEVVHDTIRTRLAAEAADSAILVLVDAPEASRRGRPGGAVADRLTAVIRGCGVDVQDAIGIRHGRYWSYLCRDRSCCPPHGLPVPAGADGDFTRVAAGFVAAGVAPLDTREALRACVEPGPAADPERVRRAWLAHAGDTAHAGDRERPIDRGVARWRAAVDRQRLGLLRPGGVPTPDEAAALVADVVDTRVRDHVIAWCGDREVRDAVLAVCRELAPLAPAPFHTQLLAVLAWAAFSAGDGALASVAIERILLTDPEHSLALLLRTGLDGGIRPDQMMQLSTEVVGLTGIPDAR